jgi:hypothetical protein
MIMEGVSTSIPYREAAREISLAVLKELAPEEVEVALGFLDPLIEMAADNELVYVKGSDHSGGFGGTDVLFASVVPAVVKALVALGMDRDTGSDPDPQKTEEVLRQASAEIKDVVRRVGSQRAADASVELLQALRKATLSYFGVVAEP